jgi:hypothetical protein
VGISEGRRRCNWEVGLCCDGCILKVGGLIVYAMFCVSRPWYLAVWVVQFVYGLAY